jgi:hypothetical protein
MSTLPFIVAAYGAILGGLALYTGLLWRRLAAARERSLRIRSEAARAEPSRPP